MTRADDVAVKRARVREFLDTQGFSGVLFTLQRSFSWYTGGGQNHVALTTEAGAASVLATAKQDYLIANNIEAPRIMEEEGLEELGFQPLVYPWDADASESEELVHRVLAGERPATDIGPHAADLKRLRYSLTPFEVERYRELGRDTAEAVADVCRRIERGQSEWRIAAMASAALLERRITPAVLLVAADERITKYRHPLPTEKQVARYAMVVVCGRRSGLILSTTRLVHFGALSPDLRRRHDAVMAIDAMFIASTQIGADVDEIFQRAVDSYEQAGFPDEWKLHHQGGATGYESRDFKGTLRSKEVVKPWQAYAWNPSITGTKSEDTIIAAPKGPEILSMVEDWPSIEFGPLPGPSILRADILVR